MNNDTKLKTNIKNLRTKKNILQTKIALDLNLSQEAISSYETGRVTPSADILCLLADYFHTNIKYFQVKCNNEDKKISHINAFMPRKLIEQWEMKILLSFLLSDKFCFSLS